MAFEKTIQSLASIEDKLRRAFGLAGPIGARLDPTLTAVVIADDLRDPGHAFFSGRSWIWCGIDTGSPAGVNVISILPQVDVLVEGCWISGTLAIGGAIEVYVTTPTEAPPIAGGVAGNFAWRDRKMVTLDVPPFTGGSSWAGITGTLISVNNRMFTWRGGTTAQIDDVKRIPIMVPAGGSLTFRSSTSHTTLQIGCYGRIFP